MPLTASHKDNKKPVHHNVKPPDRPHASNTVRYKCECEEDSLAEGFDINNYKWLDAQPKCVLRDWLAEGKVGYPKDQLSCGSCWAHTTTAAIETMDAIANHVFSRDEVLSLSEQQLLDCDLIPNMACMGGEAMYAYRYVKANGLATSEDYPYMNKLRTCVYEPEIMLAATISDYKIF